MKWVLRREAERGTSQETPAVTLHAEELNRKGESGGQWGGEDGGLK